MNIQMVKSKRAKTIWLAQHDRFLPHILDTRKLSLSTLIAMLAQYGLVYVKPDRGMGGDGVMRVERLADGEFRIRSGAATFQYGTPEKLYDAVKRLKNPGPYLVQQGIELLKHRGRRFDIRVMTQRNPAGKWETTGIIGRLAHPSRIVTNVHNGGTALPVSVLLSGHMPPSRQRDLQDNLASMGVDIARHLKAKYPGIKEIGLDIGLDSGFHPWIIEVNTLPNPFIFRKLPDKSVYRKIARYAKTYGRFNKKYCPSMRKVKRSPLPTSRPS